MIFMGYIIFCFLIFIILCINIYNLVAGKHLSSAEKTQLKSRIGVLIFVGIALLVSGGVFGQLVFFSRYTLSVVISIIVNTILLTVIFSKLEVSFNFSWLKAIYYIGIFCVFMTSILITNSYSIYEGAFETSAVVASFVLGSSFFVWLLCLFARLFLSTRSKGYSSTTTQMNFTNKDKIQHYYDEGLTETEIEYFRSQMAIARDQIKSVETGIAKTAKLRAIEVRYNTIEVAQNFFKDIVEDPTRFTQASQFLYKFLPSLEDLILKYNEINGHVAKNKQTYLILEKSAQTIKQICEQITDEYVLFHQDTYNEMQDEIKLANRNLSRKAARQQMSSEQEDIDNMTDSVDAILKESNDWLADQADE